MENPEKNIYFKNQIINNRINIKKKERCLKNIGMGIYAPNEALKGGYKDSKCPFRGSVSIDRKSVV